MKNCIILGSGRSGTSMVAGTLAKAGYHMGDELYPPRDSNPKGFFEGPQINGINEALLSTAVPDTQGLRFGQRWLASIAPTSQYTVTQEVGQAISNMIRREPYCYKDPRFSYTLPVWKPYLRNTTCICVFREPNVTADSISRECAHQSYLANVEMDVGRALRIWTSIYASILCLVDIHEDWIFVHYNQILTGERLEAISKHLGAPVDHDFPDTSLRRSESSMGLSPETMALYETLCRYSNYTEENGT